MDTDKSDLWARSLALSKPYWQLYEQLMPAAARNKTTPPATLEEVNTSDDHDQEYAMFIEITRRHQAQRNKRRKLEQESEQQFYYKDISQVNTLVEQNLSDVPDKSDPNEMALAQMREHDLIKLYGDRHTYEHIRSMEMNIDDNFNKRCLELKPHYWPAIPFNTKVYLDQTNSRQLR